ncbi:MAG: Imm52 family immunity protein [Haloechinothrix sp.]
MFHGPDDDVCSWTRFWITPKPASVRASGEDLYILDASLKKSVNENPEYADLRRVYLSRVAAEWYRQVGQTKDTQFKGLIGDGVAGPWVWGPRAEDVSRWAERLHLCLTGLASLDPTLTAWFRWADELALDTAWLRDVLEYHSDPFEGIAESGRTLTLWNGIEDDLAVAPIEIRWGSTVASVRDNVVLQLPGAAAPGLYRLETMIRLFTIMISAWQPQWRRVRPGAFAELAGRESIDVLASWIVYLDRDVCTLNGALPDDVQLVDGWGDGHGFLLTAAPDQLRSETIDRLRHAVTVPDRLR